MNNFNSQFATQKLRQETSMTGTGATFTPGTGEQTAPRATKKVVRKKLTPEEKDVEPKLAAGKAKVYMKDKWGWEDAPSVPNRPSKGGFIYKQLFEELSDFVKENQIKEEVKYTIKDILNYNHLMSAVDLAAQQIKSTKLFQLLKSLRSQSDLISALDILDNVKSIISSDPSLEKIIKLDALKAIEKIRGLYQPEEQGDDEDRYDWFTDKYEPVNDYGKNRKDPDYYEKDYQDKGTNDYFQRRSLDENYSKSEVQSRDFNVNKIWDFIESKPFNNPNYMPKFNTAEEIWNGWGPEEKEMYTNFNWEDTYGNEIHRREKAALQRRANYDALAGLNENYSKFKTETKTRGKSDQFHQAVRGVKKKVQEINRLFEYVSRLKLELSEGEEGLKYKMHTEKALAKIKEMVSELNQNIKKFK